MPSLPPSDYSITSRIIVGSTAYDQSNINSLTDLFTVYNINTTTGTIEISAGTLVRPSIIYSTGSLGNISINNESLSYTHAGTKLIQPDSYFY